MLIALHTYSVLDEHCLIGMDGTINLLLILPINIPQMHTTLTSGNF
jgi:hypothetical protein